MLSPNYVNSSNCKDEIKYAIDLDKPKTLVYLAKTQLPGAMQMRLGRVQAVYKSEYDSEEAFIQKMLEAKWIGVCYEAEDEILNWMKEEFDLNNILNNITDLEDLDEKDELENLEIPILKLESEDGMYSNLDRIEYAKKKYLILILIDEDGEELLESGEVFIARLQDYVNGQKRYFEFDDDETAQAVFALFKNKNTGYFFTKQSVG